LTLTHLTTASQTSLGCKSSCMMVWSCNLRMQNVISCNVQLIYILDIGFQRHSNVGIADSEEGKQSFF
jgi:hypothetical protein